jgi:ABC-type transport system substrate-binding protein
MMSPRKISRRRLFRHTLAQGLALGAAGIAGPLAARAWAAATPVVLMQGVDPETLDPHFGESGVMANVLSNVVEPLVWYDRQMNLVPFLAESYRVLDDKVTWRFVLRQGIKFQNGRPFDADAVKFTVERTLDPKLRAQGLNDPFPSRSGIVRVNVQNATTVDLVLKAPNVITPVFLTFLYILEPSYYASTPPERTAVRTLANPFLRVFSSASCSRGSSEAVTSLPMTTLKPRSYACRAVVPQQKFVRVPQMITVSLPRFFRMLSKGVS